MQCKDVEIVVEQEGLAPLSETARAHVSGCRHCQAFVADLATIVSVAKEFPAEVAPPSRVWVSLRAQLELEGIIKEPALAPIAERASWWHGFGGLFRGRTMATATVGLLIVVAGVLQLHQSTVPATGHLDPIFDTALTLNEQEHDLTNMQLASSSPVDTSLRQNLKQIDDFIADCERRVKEEPQDDLAREYLSNAYQQKAELLSAMMDREGSVN
jgi:hypothetical protein